MLKDVDSKLVNKMLRQADPTPVSLIEDMAFDISEGFKFGSPKPGVIFMLTMGHSFNSSLIAKYLNSILSTEGS